MSQSNRFGLVQLPSNYGDGGKKQLCQGCLVRPATDEHHRVFKGMGGRKGAAKVASEHADNKTYICRICHGAVHLRVEIASDGFCCARCPRLSHCYHGRRLLTCFKAYNLPYEGMTPLF